MGISTGQRGVTMGTSTGQIQPLYTGSVALPHNNENHFYSLKVPLSGVAPDKILLQAVR